MRKRFVLPWLLVPALAVIVAANVHAGPAPIPEHLKLPRHNVELFRTTATGVQVYVCAARPDAVGVFEWTFKAPVADLWNEAGERVGRH